MDPCEFRPADAPSAAGYRVTLTLSIEDAGALWNAAAERALQAPGMTLADVLDTIGPREDPSIADCIAMLTGPAAIAGCAVADYAILPVTGCIEAVPLHAHLDDGELVAVPAWNPQAAKSAVG